MSEVAPAAPAAAPSNPAPAPANPGNPAPEGGAPSVTPAGGDPTPSSWTQSLSPELQEFVNTKGFKDPASVLDSYRNLEKLRGVPQDRLLKLPETPDAPEWKDVYSKLGVPDNAEGYGLQATEGGDEKFLNWAKETFHGLNLTKDQAHKLVEGFNQFAQDKTEMSANEYNEKVKTQEMDLKKDWGSAYHQNVANAQNAARAFDIPGEAVDALEKVMGFDGVMKFLNNIGTKIGESNFHTGEGRQGFGGGDSDLLTPSQAKAKIASLKQDPTFTQKYLAGDGEAKARMSRLHKMAYPDD